MKSLKSLLMVAAVAVIAAFAAESRAQTVPTTLKHAITASSNVACTVVSSNLPGSLLVTNNVPLNTGLSIAPLFNGSQSTNTGLLALFWDTSQDGTNFTTTQPLITWHTANGTTTVRDWTNIPPTVLNNVRKIKLSKITNSLANSGPGSITVTNVLVGTQ
jgi:hypothetical protein